MIDLIKDKHAGLKTDEGMSKKEKEQTNSLNANSANDNFLSKKVSFELPISNKDRMSRDFEVTEYDIDIDDSVSSIGADDDFLKEIAPKKFPTEEKRDNVQNLSDLEFVTITEKKMDLDTLTSQNISPQMLHSFSEEEPAEGVLAPLLDKIDDYEYEDDNYYSYQSSPTSILSSLIGGGSTDSESDDYSESCDSASLKSSSSLMSSSSRRSIKSNGSSTIGVNNLRRKIRRSSTCSTSSTASSTQNPSNSPSSTSLPLFGFGPSSAMALDYVRARAQAHNDYIELSCSAPSSMTPGISSILDLKHGQIRSADSHDNVNVVSFLNITNQNRIDVYYTTCTIVLICAHPICKERKARIFKMDCTIEDLDEFLNCDETPNDLIAKIAFGGSPNMFTQEAPLEEDAPSEKHALTKQMAIIDQEIQMLKSEQATLQQNYNFHEERAQQALLERERFLKYVNRQYQEQRNARESEAFKAKLILEVEESLAGMLPCCFSDERCCYDSNENKWWYFNYWPFVDVKRKKMLEDLVNDVRVRNSIKEDILFHHQYSGNWLELDDVGCLRNLNKELVEELVQDEKSRLSSSQDYHLDENDIEPKRIVYSSVGQMGQYYIKYSNHTYSFLGPTELTFILEQSNIHDIKCIAFGSTWDTYFLVFQNGSWRCNGDAIPIQLLQQLQNISFKANVKSVALGQNGEWFLETYCGKFWWFGVYQKCIEMKERQKEQEMKSGANLITHCGTNDYTVEISIYRKSHSYAILKMPQY